MVKKRMPWQWNGRAKSPVKNFTRTTKYESYVASFPPGAKHLRHQHPASFGYWLSGGKVEALNASGTRQVETVTDAATLSPAIPWHEVTNIGDTTLRYLVYLVVEMKYKQ